MPTPAELDAALVRARNADQAERRERIAERVFAAIVGARYDVAGTAFDLEAFAHDAITAADALIAELDRPQEPRS